jgi:hypothetical protein
MGFYLDKDGVVDPNGTRIVHGRSSNLKTYTNMTMLTADTYNKVAELNGLARGAHLVSVYWTGGYNSNTSNIHWETSGVGVVGIVSASSYYNGNPYQPIAMNFTHHYRSVDNPTFYLDSDNSNGQYGKLSLYLKPAVDEKFNGFAVYAQQITDVE